MLEEWQKFVLEKYIIYQDGRVYSLHSSRFLKPDIVRGYEQFTLQRDGLVFREKGHRLVAYKYIPAEKGKTHINHKDGNKRNNHYSNLEWCTPYENNKHARELGLNNISKSNRERWSDVEFNRRVSRKISETLIKNGTFRGRNNPRFRYLILKDGKEITRQQVVKITGFAQSTVDTKIRRASQGDVCPRFKKFNIVVIDTKEDVQTNERVG